MSDFFPIAEILEDLEQAEEYKSNGEIGRSRVLARLAAGKALRYWLISSGFVSNLKITPFKALELSVEHPQIPEILRKSIRNLLQKVNYDYTFPDEIDLIKDSGKIIEFISKKVSDE